jgi:hypothetical protein
MISAYRMFLLPNDPVKNQMDKGSEEGKRDTTRHYLVGIYMNSLSREPCYHNNMIISRESPDPSLDFWTGK